MYKTLAFIGGFQIAMLPAFGGSQLRVAGIPLKLPGNTLVLHVSESVHLPAGVDEAVSGVDPRETPENVYRLVRDAARAWTQTGKAALSIQVERTPERKVSESNLNLVTFTDTEPFDTGMCDKALYIACTLVFHNDATGKIPMVKIAFNPYKQHSSLGKKGAHDLGVVLLHELGHAVGLDHSTAPDAIMSPVVELELSTGSVTPRRLSSDDVSTIAMAYPLPEPIVPPSILAGAISRDGLAVAKAHVLAFNTSGQTAAASGAATNFATDFELQPIREPSGGGGGESILHLRHRLNQHGCVRCWLRSFAGKNTVNFADYRLQLRHPRLEILIGKRGHCGLPVNRDETMWSASNSCGTNLSH
jgi:hypothetical protein